MIPLSVPEIGGNAWKYVKECLDTGWVSSSGSFVERFEKKAAERLGAGRAVAVSSGTAAIHIALLLAGVEAGDLVLLPTLTFVATVNPVLYLGARPVFLDSEKNTWGLDADAVRRFIHEHCDDEGGSLVEKESRARVRAILPVHLYGRPAEMDPLLGLAAEYGLKVVEDAAEGLGSTYKGRAAGVLGDLGCLSFNGNKIITTGGGGMILTADPDLADRARYLTTQARDNPVDYHHSEVGYNYRLTNLQAALGVAQLERLDEFVAVRRRNAALYRELLADAPGIEPCPETPASVSNCWIFTILVDEEEYGRGPRQLMELLSEEGIESRPFFHPAHLLPPYRSFPRGPTPVAEELFKKGLCLPSSSNLTTKEVRAVCRAIGRAGR